MAYVAQLTVMMPASTPNGVEQLRIDNALLR
jgi:hypothetical protein